MAINLEAQALANEDYRKILVTGQHLKLTIMSVEDEIPMEIHRSEDQLLFILDGEVTIELYHHQRSARPYITITVLAGQAYLVPSNTYHRVVVQRGPVKLFSVYGH